ncbi:sarcosine oxidase subunit gamma family protein [Marinobacterium arenosum]|uniref:sarcosine oxidase subunit gamma family protein n=1 Tax=Marinobacterium arenosum TaxID=2862496 RepID=UPI001C947A82|nr:sarcosine oxidase subunit gamma family protein [Marinobacterium arenosum]MBY4675177.1 sarcosine oxidase subunit gamma family protein [Marinobacterium arenosum]
MTGPIELQAGQTAELPMIASPLAHLNINVQFDSRYAVSGLMVREQPFIGELKLDTDPDNLALLIAVGEVMGVQQPLTVTRLSCIGSLAILWLDAHHWLVLPTPGRNLTVQEALEETFGDDLQIDQQDGQQRLRLSEAAIRYLLESQNTREEHRDGVARRSAAHHQLKEQGVQLLPLSDSHDILVRQSCADQLCQWLSRKELKLAANG